MKKLFIPFVFILLLLSGCGVEETPETYTMLLNGEYSANITVKEEDAEYTARINQDENGMFSIVFAEPAMLWGMGYSFEGDDSFLIYNDMSIELDGKSISASAKNGVFRWREMLKCGGEYSVSAESLNGKTVLKLSDGENEVYFDKATKEPIMFKSDKTTITINEWNGKKSDVQTQDIFTDK